MTSVTVPYFTMCHLNHDSTTPIQSMELGLYENFDYPLVINDVGFVLGGYENTIETQTFDIDSKNVIKFTVYESTKIQHISLYTNLRDNLNEIHESDTQILYNDGQPIEVIDPHGRIHDDHETLFCRMVSRLPSQGNLPRQALSAS